MLYLDIQLMVTINKHWVLRGTRGQFPPPPLKLMQDASCTQLLQAFYPLPLSHLHADVMTFGL